MESVEHNCNQFYISFHAVDEISNGTLSFLPSYFVQFHSSLQYAFVSWNGFTPLWRSIYNHLPSKLAYPHFLSPTIQRSQNQKQSSNSWKHEWKSNLSSPIAKSISSFSHFSFLLVPNLISAWVHSIQQVKGWESKWQYLEEGRVLLNRT